MKTFQTFLSALLMVASTTVGAWSYDGHSFPGKGDPANYRRSLPKADAAAKLLTQGKYQDALNQYDRAITIYPFDASMHSNRGAALSGLSKHVEAVKEFRKAIELEPSWADGYNNLADELKILKDFKGAEANTKKAIALSPADPLPLLTLAELYIDMGRKADAQQLISRAAKMPAAKNDNFIQETIKSDLDKLSRIR
ncbi:MAG: tetratricopeptide repeat protein [Candidatus Obscuribacterales bacterium]|jgi:Flp pilus assembly protein TadD|nr:tetratricopeptide repeat protein [Candidatus Obscuribacterales bacterium]